MALLEGDEIYQKMARYCGYQERTEQEVRSKLQTLGVTRKEVEDEFVQTLKRANFLDDRRYVEVFIRGKVLVKHWGKRRLWAVLTKKGIDPRLVQSGLDKIEDTDYIRSLHEVINQKKRSLLAKDPIQRRRRLINYLLQKGYEHELVHQVLE